MHHRPTRLITNRQPRATASIISERSLWAVPLSQMGRKRQLAEFLKSGMSGHSMCRQEYFQTGHWRLRRIELCRKPTDATCGRACRAAEVPFTNVHIDDNGVELLGSTASLYLYLTNQNERAHSLPIEIETPLVVHRVGLPSDFVTT